MLFEQLFLYAALPAMASAFTLLRPSWHDMAALMWAAIGLLYLSRIGLVFVIVALLIAGIHGYIAIRDVRNKKIKIGEI